MLCACGTAVAQGPIPEPIVKGDAVIELQTIATGLNQPNYLTHAGDGSGRQFLIERNGPVRVVNGGVLNPTPFLDVSSRVVLQGEAGLLGLAFHPGYANPTDPGFGKFYTYTSEEATGTPDFPVPNGGTNHHSVITEWTVSSTNPQVADPASRREVLRIAQPQSNHNGGAIAFSPTDGRLYIALGDGGGANDVGSGHTPDIGNGQDGTNVLGDILRINPLAPSATPGSSDLVSANGNYRVPIDNPFLGASPNVDEIFATGFRNPYRMSFDVANGQLVVGDVGQANIEEVDLVNSGGNYGWNEKEGTFLFDPSTGGVSVDPSPDPDLIDPVLQYDHDEGNSIIGGFVYRGTALPELTGDYIFGDLSGRLFVGDLTTGEIEELIIGLDDRDFAGSLIGFGEDEQNELYVLSGDTVFRIVPAAVPEPGSLALLAGLFGTFGALRLRRRDRR